MRLQDEQNNDWKARINLVPLLDKYRGQVKTGMYWPTAGQLDFKICFLPCVSRANCASQRPICFFF